MESFEELGLSPELVAALASEGAEEPTPFQVAAIPVNAPNPMAQAGLPIPAGFAGGGEGCCAGGSERAH